MARRLRPDIGKWIGKVMFTNIGKDKKQRRYAHSAQGDVETENN